jgi:threonine aldolase
MASILERIILPEFKVRYANVIWEESKKKAANDLKKKAANQEAEESTDSIKNKLVRFAKHQFDIDEKDVDFSQIVF